MFLGFLMFFDSYGVQTGFCVLRSANRTSFLLALCKWSIYKCKNFKRKLNLLLLCFEIEYSQVRVQIEKIKKKNLKSGQSLEFILAKWLELKRKKNWNWNCFKVQPLRGELSNFPRSSWIGVSAKQTKKPYLIEIDSVKWTGKVPVRTAITDTCEGQVSAALLQWQVLQFFYATSWWNEIFLSCWILTQLQNEQTR